MRNKNQIIIILLIFLSITGCNEDKGKDAFPANKLYIIDWGWSYSDSSKFSILGFSEVDSSFTVKSCFLYDPNHYYTSEFVIPDSIRSRIVETISNYNTDTLYDIGDKLTRYTNMDSNCYFYIKKANGKNAVVGTAINYLPDDLLFLYNYLYNDRKSLIKRDSLKNIFEEFEKEMKFNYEQFHTPIKFALPGIKQKR